MTNQVGKRYICASCRTEMLVTRGGDGQLSCCGQPMHLRGVGQPAPEPRKVEHA
jgi:hypothetical protein